MRRLVSLIVATPLVLASCSNESDEFESAPSISASESQAPTNKSYSLNNTVDIAGVIVSDIELHQEGCEFNQEPASDAIKFELIATVENTTTEAIVQALWPSEFSFTDKDGFEIEHLDLEPTGEPPCSSNNPSQFIDLQPGAKRRAAIALVAPPSAQKMTYSTTLIPNAEPITWDLDGALNDFTVSSPDSQSGNSKSSKPVVGFTESPSEGTPHELDKTIRECGDPALHQLGTSFFTDGTSGWTQQCADEMGS
ncbi:hypothetical protein QP907_00440 [Corynebacterium pseudodiphtheriticum]|uniref:hypothetical protein n=1 Tax=Corynebacterium pseudodiphtheriticum TaxID=37637 RepID=UPI00254F7410|nr:hypothetical protein [Corynebacterium pseudodiphtheriticum]MDK8550794.1 hypothetical protein [Corynebacterium pseudodiphtheriticum]